MANKRLYVGFKKANCRHVTLQLKGMGTYNFQDLLSVCLCAGYLLFFEFYYIIPICCTKVLLYLDVTGCARTWFHLSFIS